MTRFLLLPAALLATTSTALADEELSEAQTSYTGAIMLEGDEYVTLGGYASGDYSPEEKFEQSEYAYFTGNTLYFGASDVEGNSLDGIAEFFWFESSIDRGSDFYVAIIKVRNTPNVDEGWYLEVGDDPVLSVRADTDTSAGVGAFRWDWSVPFENYGMDSYGEVTMKTEYGIGGDAEGSAMYAKKVDEDGASAEVDVQAKGYVNSEYKVSTQYQVTLYRWNTWVAGSAAYMDWELVLDNKDRDDQSAYHEYFLVMQVEEGEDFTIESLDIGGAINGWWWGQGTSLGVTLEDITLSQPPFDPGWDDEDEDTGDWDTGDDGTDDWTDKEDDSEDDEGTGNGWGSSDDADEGDEGDVTVSLFGCSSAPAAPAGLLGIFGMIALALVGRRED